MTVSWDTRWDEDTPADRWQADMDNAFLIQRTEGWQPQTGWRRPVDPACPTHGYGLVDGFCGVCIQELQQRRAA